MKTVEASGFWKNDDYIAKLGNASIAIGSVQKEGDRFACYFFQCLWPMRYFRKYETAIRYVESNLSREKEFFWIENRYFMKIGKYKMPIGGVGKVGIEYFSSTILGDLKISDSLQSAMDILEREFAESK